MSKGGFYCLTEGIAYKHLDGCIYYISRLQYVPIKYFFLDYNNTF